VAWLYYFVRYGVHVASRSFHGMKSYRLVGLAAILLLASSFVAGLHATDKSLWKAVPFAIVKFNDDAPKSWNMYHSEKKGLLLLHLWKRYLLLDVKGEEVFEIDPQTVKPAGDDVEWSLTDKPEQPIETPEWKTRDLVSVERIRFRLGKNGYILELQIPLQANGKPIY
jgi:hypothetical protein